MSGHIALLGLLCLMLTACGGGGDLAWPSSDATGVRIAALSAGSECPNGGSLLTSTSTMQYVCNGSNGQNALVQPAQLPVGDVNCPQGGTRARMGQDANDNLVLDPDEVSLTRDMCETAARSNSSTAPDSLVVITTAPAGTECPSGGEKVASGVDTNGDGVLQPVEVTNFSHVCHRGNGIGALITTQALVAGDSNCPYGGTRVISGADSDGSGGLLNADGSVNVNNATKTSYVCRGLPGASATGVSELLVSSITVAAGNANCSRGGTEIVTGRNVDGTGALINADGSLSAANALDATYVCSGNTDPAWVNVTGAAQHIASNAGYAAANDTVQVVLTLPTQPQIGDVVRIEGSGLAGWRVAQNEGQSIDLQGLPVQASPSGSPLATISGPAASLSGGAADSMTLIFLGNGKFGVQNSSGSGFIASDPGSAAPPTGPEDSPSNPVDSTSNPPVSLPSFTFGDLTKAYGSGPFQLSSPVPGQDGAFSYTSNNPGVAQISGNTVTIVGAGVATLTATLLTTRQSATATLTVNKAPAGLQLQAMTVKALTSETPYPPPFVPLSAKTNSDGALTYALSNLVISGTGDPYDAAFLFEQNGATYLYPGLLPATATITISQSATANYEGAIVSAPLIVQKGLTFIQIDGKYLNATGVGTFDFPIGITQESPFDPGAMRSVVATVSDPSVADVWFYYQPGNLLPTIGFRPKIAGSTLLTVSVAATANLAAASITVPLSVLQSTGVQKGMSLVAVANARALYDAASPLYSYVPTRSPPVKLATCVNKTLVVTFAFDFATYIQAFQSGRGQTITVSLSDGVIEYRLGDPGSNYAPRYNSVERSAEYSYEFPSGAFAGQTKNYTLKSKISGYGAGTASVIGDAELTYAVQTEAQAPFVDPSTGEHNDCLTSGPQ